MWHVNIACTHRKRWASPRRGRDTPASSWYARNPGHDDGSSSAQQVALITQTSPLSLLSFSSTGYHWETISLIAATHILSRVRKTRRGTTLAVSFSPPRRARARHTRLTRGSDTTDTPTDLQFRERETTGRREVRRAEGTRGWFGEREQHTAKGKRSLHARAHTRDARDGEQIWTEARASDATGSRRDPISLSLALPPSLSLALPPARAGHSRCQVADLLSRSNNPHFDTAR